MSETTLSDQGLVEGFRVVEEGLGLTGAGLFERPYPKPRIC
jgi:hypothetical protein